MPFDHLAKDGERRIYNGQCLPMAMVPPQDIMMGFFFVRPGMDDVTNDDVGGGL